MCDGKPCTQIGVGSDCSQSFEGGLRQSLVGAVEEVGIRPLPSSSNATPQLVKLRQSKRVCPVNDQGVGIRDVKAGLNDGRGNQYVELVIPEIDDCLLKFGLGQLSMRHPNPGFRHQLLKSCRDLIDRIDSVVNEEDLAVPQ